MTYDAAHILVVDDDALIRKALKLHLETAGYHVCLAANGLEAVAALEQVTPDIIILDIFMPDMDGFETLRRVNSRTARARILAISGGGSTMDCDFLDMAFKLGAHSVLKKPFTASQLATAIEALLAASATH